MPPGSPVIFPWYYGFKMRLSELGLEILDVKEGWSAQDKLTAMILENFFMAMVA